MSRIKSWVPNIFTMGNLSLGFFSMLLSLTADSNPGNLTLAGFLILLAVLCDGLDGFAARKLNVCSDLGAQLDSLADMTAFGIAPGVLMYSLHLKRYVIVMTEHTYLPLGMFLAAIFPLCAAYRLARFNVQHSHDSFRGLPSPIAGMIVGLMPLVTTERFPIPSLFLVLVFIVAAFLMVSTVKYSKPQVSIRYAPFRLALLLIFLVASLIFVGFRYDPEIAFVGVFFIIIVYVMSGFVGLMIQLIQKYRM